MPWPKGKPRGPMPQSVKDKISAANSKPDVIQKHSEARRRNREEWLKTATPEEVESKRKAQHDKRSATLQALFREGKMTPRQLGKPISDSHREAIAESNRRRVFTPEIRENMSKSQRGKKQSAQQRQELSERMKARVAAGEWQNPILLPHDEEKRRANLSKAHKGRKQRPEWVEKRIAATAKKVLAKPNSLETRVAAALALAFPGAGFFYNCETVISRKVPDFLRADGVPIAVDVHGDYWHQGEDVEARKQAYGDAGYTLVVVWEHEFDADPNILIERVRLAEQEHSRKGAEEMIR